MKDLHLSATRILDMYQALRPSLPQANFPSHYLRHHTLGDISDNYDAFFFDAFGVLNLGERAIPLAVERIAQLKAAGKFVCIVSNAASVTIESLYKKYSGLGFAFTPEEIISSRQAMLAYLSQTNTQTNTQTSTQSTPINPSPQKCAVIAPIGTDTQDIATCGHFSSLVNVLEHPEYMDEAEQFILLSSQDWTQQHQALLIENLQRKPRPILLANPDLVAPREDYFSLEPGYLAKAIQEATGISAKPFGKPYANIFDLAKQKLPPHIRNDKILMIGDTLHTDIIGGAAAGVHTALVCANGFASTIDWQACIAQTGITPHYVIDYI